METAESFEDESIVGTVLGEVAARSQRGERVDLELYLKSFPEHREELRTAFAGLAQFLDICPPEKEEDCAPVSGYRVLRLLGTGGMAHVYLAEQLAVKRRVALKVLRPEIRGNLDILARFHREAAALGMLSHPNIASVCASGVENDTHYLAMQYCEGETLQALVEKEERPPGSCNGERATSSGSPLGWPRFVLQTAVQVADALAYTHSHGVLHRDVKPSNIIVDRAGGGTWVVDFGLAKVLDSEEATLTCGPLGTPRYSSPEQAAGGKVNERSDVYSLGATLRRLLTRPSDGDEPAVWLPGASRDLQLVIARATEREPELRYAAMAALRDDLHAVSRGEPPRVRKGQAARRTYVYLKRHKPWVAAIASTLLLAAVIAAYVAKERSQARWELYKKTVEEAVVKLELGQAMRWGESVSAGDVRMRSLIARFGIESSLGQDGADPLLETITLLDSATSTIAGRPEAYYYRARARLLLHEDDAALADLAQAVRLDRRFVPARVLRDATLERRGGSASADIGTGPAGKTTDPMEEAWVSLYSAIRARHWLDAAEIYGKLIDNAPISGTGYVGAFLESYLGRGTVFLKAHKYEQAVENFAVVRALAPDALEPAILLGRAYVAMGNAHSAETVFKSVFAVTPYKDTAAIRIAGVYYVSGDWTSALHWVRQVKDLLLRSLRELSLLSLLKRFKEAETLALNLRERYPENAIVQRELTSIFREEGKLAESLAAGERAIALDGRCYLLRGSLAQTHLELGHTGQALKLLEEEVALDPRNPLVHGWIGELLYKHGMNIPAVHELEEALRLDAGDVWAHLSLANLQLDAGRMKEAQRLFEEALRLSHDSKMDAEIHVEFGNLREVEGRLPDAFREYLAAIEQDPPVVLGLAGSNLRAFLLHKEDTRQGIKLDGLVNSLEQFRASGKKDALSLSLLALALCHAESRRDLHRALECSLEALEAPGGEESEVLDTLVRVVRELTGGAAVQASMQQALVCLPRLPCFAAIDALLSAFPPAPGAENEISQRFGSALPGSEAAFRIAYLRAALEQQGGRYPNAAAALEDLTAQNAGRPEPVLHLVECLRAQGIAEKERSLRARVGALVPIEGRGDSAITQWDFEGNLDSSTGEAPLVSGAAKPAAAPEVSFTTASIGGKDAHVATFSRGTFFRLEHGLCGAGTSLDRYTLILDVCFPPRKEKYAALWQTDEKNSDDADWSFHPDRGVGICAAYGGHVEDGVWYRLALAVDVPAKSFTSYVNGRRVQSLPEEKVRAARFTLRPAALLFADEDEENAAGLVNSVQLRAYAMTPAEVASRGGPMAEGIPLPGN